MNTFGFEYDHDDVQLCDSRRDRAAGLQRAERTSAARFNTNARYRRRRSGSSGSFNGAHRRRAKRSNV